MGSDTLLELTNLEVDFNTAGRRQRALHDVSFSARRGRILGVVGESGSGKSLTAKAIMRMLPDGAELSSGTVRFRGQDLGALPETEMRAIRGRHIAMVFQDPQAALNPVKTVGWQIEEALRVHGMPKSKTRARALDLLTQVGIPDPEARIDEFPHQFSGGMRQRVVIAAAMAHSASLMIADEPTTALDVTIQAQVLRLLADLRTRLGLSVILITHDMGVVAELCDDVAVMYGGRVIERGEVREVFADPHHPYTRALLHAMPRVDTERQQRLTAIPGAAPDLTRLPSGCAFHPRCPLAESLCLDRVPDLRPIAGQPTHEAACHIAQREGRLPVGVEGLDTPALDEPHPDKPVSVPMSNAGSSTQTPAPIQLEVTGMKVAFGESRGLFRPSKLFYAVDGVSFTVSQGETVGLVGESGCGKTTVARTIVGLNPLAEGNVRVGQTDVTEFDQKSARHVHKTVQYVFQDPFASLNPRLNVRQILFEALEQRGVPPRDREAECLRLMELVRLDPSYLGRYPRAFSGGQRQRIGIARALAVEPKVLICDEPVSALDVSIQAQVINILAELRDTLGLAILFIAHDLAVVRHLSDRVMVMYLGHIVEEGPVQAVYANPRHPYTAVLMSSTPSPEPDPEAMSRKVILHGELPNPRQPPSGCRFRTRCPIGPLYHPERQVCIDKVPTLQGADGHRAACHFSEEAALNGAREGVEYVQ